MELILYPLLRGNARKAILRTAKRFGHSYQYEPRGNLLQRLSRETGMSLEEVRTQLVKEQEYLIKNE